MFSVQIVICVCIILIVFALIIKDVDVGKYNIKNNESIIAKEAEENYLKDFPKYTIKDLKIEIEKIADILIENQESNRYTDILREKVKKDYRIKAIKEGFVNSLKNDIESKLCEKGIIVKKIEIVVKKYILTDLMYIILMVI